MKNRAHVGSVMVMLLLFFTALTICTINLMRGSSFMVDLIHKRQIFMQRQWAAEGLLRYGIALCKANAEPLLEYAVQGRQATIVFEQWPCGDRGVHQGQLQITIDDTRNNLCISAQLQNEQGENLFALKSMVRIASAVGDGSTASDTSNQWTIQNMNIDYDA